MTGPTHYVDGVHPVTLITTTSDGSTALVEATGSTDRQTVPMARLTPIPTHTDTSREAPTMPALQPGTEWQARTFRDAAATVSEDYRENYGSNGARRASYCAGVRDAFRALLGEQPEDLPTEFQRIRNAYLSAI